MTTESYSNLIEKTLRLLTPTQVEQQLQITTDYVAGSGTLVVDSTAAALAACRPGAILANGLNLFYVSSVASNTLTVVGGYQGSTDVSQAHGATQASTATASAPAIIRLKSLGLPPDGPSPSIAVIASRIVRWGLASE